VPCWNNRAVEKAMIDSGTNRNKWTTTAIVEKLQRDGYLTDQNIKGDSRKVFD